MAHPLVLRVDESRHAAQRAQAAVQSQHGTLDRLDAFSGQLGRLIAQTEDPGLRLSSVVPRPLWVPPQPSDIPLFLAVSSEGRPTASTTTTGTAAVTADGQRAYDSRLAAAVSAYDRAASAAVNGFAATAAAARAQSSGSSKAAAR